MSYDPELLDCFDSADLLFCANPVSQERAFLWLGALRRRSVSWPEVSAQIEEFLRERDTPVFHVLDQIDRAKRFLGPWLPGPANDA